MSNKSRSIDLLLCIFLGIFGAHRFYEKKIITGILYFLTLGFMGIGVLFDLFQIIIGWRIDKEGYKIKYWKRKDIKSANISLEKEKVISKKECFMNTIISIITVICFLTISIKIYDYTTSHFIKYKNISYGSNERNIMDIYIPDTAKDRINNGAIIFIHGGGWTTGDKNSEKSLMKKYANKGYVTASINYRLIDDSFTYNLFDMLDDVQASIEKLKEITEKKGVNINKLALHGVSAGGHIANMYSYTRSDKSPIELVFLVNLVGPVDYNSSTWNEWNYDETSGPGIALMLYGSNVLKNGNSINDLNESEVSEVIKSVSPLNYINENSIPSINGYAGEDLVVPTKNRDMLKDRLAELKIEHEFYIFENSNHILLNDKETKLSLYNAMDEYCEKHFGY